MLKGITENNLTSSCQRCRTVFAGVEENEKKGVAVAILEQA